jgi:hypothetical protein
MSRNEKNYDFNQKKKIFFYYLRGVPIGYSYFGSLITTNQSVIRYGVHKELAKMPKSAFLTEFKTRNKACVAENVVPTLPSVSCASTLFLI